MTPPDSLRERAEKMAQFIAGEQNSPVDFMRHNSGIIYYIESELRAVQQEAWEEAIERAKKQSVLVTEDTVAGNAYRKALRFLFGSAKTKYPPAE